MQCEIRVHQHKWDLSDELNEDRSEEVIEDWSGSHKSVGRRGGVRCAHREVKIEEADGGSSWEEGVGFAFLVLRGEMTSKWKRKYSHAGVSRRSLDW